MEYPEHDQKRNMCPNHSVCQKMKAENECFKASVKQRFGSILRQWKIDNDLKHKIIEIIELILSRDFYINQDTDLYRDDSCKNSCGIQKQINNHNKLQFYKINFFIESLEKSRISPIHIHRIHIFLQTQIFDHLKIQDFFEQMLSVESLYRCEASGTTGPCKAGGTTGLCQGTSSRAGGLSTSDARDSSGCGKSIPVDANIDEIIKHFYLHLPNVCKSCYHEKYIQSFGAKAQPGESLKPDGSGLEVNILKPLTKMYLCMKCGEDNYINFYERNKSKCRFCILAEKRGLDAEAIFNLEHKLAPSASKSHHCKHCHTEDPKNFREGYKSLCYACYLNEKREKDRKKKENSAEIRVSLYFCKDCETDLPYKFRRGYKTQCYECFLKEKRNSSLLKKREVITSSSKDFKTSVLEETERCFDNVLCKHCKDTNPRNFNMGMQSVCARCEDIETEAYICKTCHLECLRNCFSESQLAKPEGDRLCNLCDPEAIAALAIEKSRKIYKCETCNETRSEEFYSGSKGKCKACAKEERKWRYRTTVVVPGTTK
jgi:hypothetical protein